MYMYMSETKEAFRPGNKSLYTASYSVFKPLLDTRTLACPLSGRVPHYTKLDNRVALYRHTLCFGFLASLQFTRGQC